MRLINSYEFKQKLLDDRDLLVPKTVNNTFAQAVRYGFHRALRCMEQCTTIGAKPVKHSNPLTIDELRTMHGKPVWIEQENTWGIVCVDEGGLWKDIPFVVFFFKNVRCEYSIEERGLTCYHHEPVKHGRWEERPTGRYGQWQSWCSACGKHSGIGGIESNRHKPYCPNCGAKMDLN